MRVIRVVGLLALLSVLVWAVTGVGWWAPFTEPGIGRPIVLVSLHALAMFAALMSYLE